MLMLASAYQCRWEVTVEKGAVLAGVALLGGGAQELTGTDATVVYVAGYVPSGEQLHNRASYSSTQKGKSYELMVADMKNITGRDFTRFQGHSKAPKEPIVVTPGAAK
ncbi:hypothetical protein C1280_06055 [Gemmata obscuriglobus]|uniref:Uncharacterized protein n=1 Tax=Gemmata obscuriglobus TaxID=114 RepID=A0A2Z3GQP4_9BACT|nr:hypothetical protein C1280_06055 [Gemmata obscuriglobus]